MLCACVFLQHIFMCVDCFLIVMHLFACLIPHTAYVWYDITENILYKIGGINAFAKYEEIIQE